MVLYCSVPESPGVASVLTGSTNVTQSDHRVFEQAPSIYCFIFPLLPVNRKAQVPKFHPLELKSTALNTFFFTGVLYY